MENRMGEIHISGLTNLDKLEIDKYDNSGAFRFEKEIQGNDSHGELATLTAVVIISLAALRVLAIHLVKKHNRQTFKQRFEITKPDGTLQTIQVEYTASSSESPEAEVLKELALACNVDISQTRDLDKYIDEIMK